MLQNLRIRWKLVVIFLLPALTLLFVAGSRMWTTADAGRTADSERHVLAFSEQVGDFVHELQQERSLSVTYLGSGKRQGGDELTAQRSKVDAAIVAYRADSQDLAGDAGDRVDKAMALAGERLEKLVTQRRSIDRLPVSVEETLDFYDGVINGLLSLDAGIAAEASDPEVLRSASTFVALASIKEAAAQQRDIGMEAILAGRFPTGGRERLTAAIATEVAWVKRFQATATDAQWTALATRISGPEVAEAERLRQAILAEARQGQITADPKDWVKATDARLGALRDQEQVLGDGVLDANRAVARELSRDFLNDLLLTFVIIALAVGFAMNMARSMVRPLALLRDAANDVAERRLPQIVERLQRSERIDPKAEAVALGNASRDEIGQVAKAFTSAHEVAVQVATEQAALRKSIGDMFLNLARRSQTLIDRQIELIDELERNETDPDALQELFQLDHLATRLRRNAEDLIVLSGAKPTRRWTRPVPLYDVIRAATAEVEDYTRIELLPIDDLGVTGQAVADVIHMLAELVENATSFSPPGTKVHIAGQPVGGGYMVEIEDRGVGMSDDELIEINQRLANPPVIDLTLSRRLGLFVVSRLASRYGIRVQLRHSWYGGVTALVLLPDVLLVRAAGVPDPGAAPVEPEHRTSGRLFADRPGAPAGAGALADGNGGPIEQTPGVPSPPWSLANVAKPYVPLRRHATHPGHGPALPLARRTPAPPAEMPPPGGGQPPAAPSRPGPGFVDVPPVVPPAPAAGGPGGLPRRPKPAGDGPGGLPRRPKRQGPGVDAPAARGPQPGGPDAPTDDAVVRPSAFETTPDLEPSPPNSMPPAPVAPVAPAPTAPVAEAGEVSLSAGGHPVTADQPFERTEPNGVNPTPPVTKVGLPRRIPRANLAPAWVAGPGSPAPPGASGRSPDEVRDMLSNYRIGLERGRHESGAAGEAGDQPAAPAGPPVPPSEDDTPG